MLTLGVVMVLVQAVYVASLAWLARRSPVLLPQPPVVDDAPMISVVLPVRDEERNVVGCLDSLLAQDYPRFEVIVVDDGSTDDTAALLAGAAVGEPRLRIVHGEPLPPGWTGKSFAVCQGAELAAGEWLLFVDADVRLHRAAMSTIYRSALRHGVALVTVAPRHDLRSFWERSVQAVIVAMHSFGEAFQRQRSPWSPTAGPANGAFLLVEHDTYRAIGGHEAVRAFVLEDFELSRRLRQLGHASVSVNGALLASIRMYRSLPEIWQGWSRISFLGMRHGILESVGAAAVVGLVCCGPAALSATALHDAFVLGRVTAALPLAVVGWLFLASAGALLRPLVPVPIAYLVTVPLGGLVLIGILLNSAYRHTVGDGVPWKERRYGAASGSAAER